MTKLEFCKLFNEQLSKIDISIKDEQIEKFYFKVLQDIRCLEGFFH